MEDGQGGAAIPVFTDDHAAARFAEATGQLDEVEMVPVDATFLAEVIEGAAAVNYANTVVFDPTGINDTRRVWPIAYVAERVRKDLSL
jgi:hypothetical protein